MAVQLEDVSLPTGLEKLNEHLHTRSYISGYQASRDDLAVYTHIHSPPDCKYMNVARWYSHITALLGASFPGAHTGVRVTESPASLATRGVTPAPVAPAPEAVSVASTRSSGHPAPAPEAVSVASTSGSSSHSAPALEAVSVASTSGTSGHPAEEEEDDDDLDLFGEETEEEKAAAAKRESEKKASGKKPVVGKSSVLLDVKPWDDETDMMQLEEAVRSVQLEGLTWGASKLVDVCHRIKKMQIMMTVVDDLVSPDNVIEDFLTTEPRNAHIQSCDIVAFNKICE